MDNNREEIIEETFFDDYRRSKQFQKMTTSRKWLDFDTGSAGISDLLSPMTKQAFVIAPQFSPRKVLNDLGYSVYENFKNVKFNDLRVVTPSIHLNT